MITKIKCADIFSKVHSSQIHLDGIKLLVSNLKTAGCKTAEEFGDPLSDYLTERSSLNHAIYNDLSGLVEVDPAEADQLKDVPPIDVEGIKMGAAAKKYFDTMYSGEKTSAVVDTLNEIIKIGRANVIIQEMKKQPAHEKIANELDNINKDYLVSLLGEFK